MEKGEKYGAGVRKRQRHKRRGFPKIASVIRLARVSATEARIR